MKKPKILFIAPYLARSGWGFAARQYIKSLSLHSNLSIQNLDMGGSTVEKTDEIKSLEKNNLNSYDVLFQMTLPHLMYRDGRFKINAGLFFQESTPSFNFVNKIRLLDHLFVASIDEKNDLQNKLLNNRTKIHNIKIPYENFKESQDISQKFKKNKSTYVFYTIAENNERKNLVDLIYSYFISFKSYDNVVLLIKSNKNIDEEIKIAKQYLRLKNEKAYPSLICINENLNEYEIASMHKSANCFVTMSHSESWCLPAIDAAEHKNHIIVPESCGALDILKNKCSLDIVECYYDNCKVKNPPVSGYYRNNDCWSYPLISDMSRYMVSAYKNRRILKIEDGWREDISYDSVGKKIIKCLMF